MSFLFVNASRLRQNGCHFADGNLNCIFFNENHYILIQIALNFSPKSPLENNSTLVEVMAWLQTGDKPLCEPMLVQFNYAYIIHHSASMG